MGLVCYNPVKGIDDLICKTFKDSNIWTPYRIANLRGQYDETHPDNNLDTSNIQIAANTLAEFERDQRIKRAEKIKSSTNQIVKSVLPILSHFSTHEKRARVGLISEKFSQEIDKIQKNYPSMSRIDIANGFIIDKKQVGGQYTLFENMYNDFLKQYENLVMSEDFQNDLKTLKKDSLLLEKAAALQKLLDHWTGLVVMARKDLQKTENLLLGNHINYAKSLADVDYNGELDEVYSAEEEVRESWQQVNDTVSAFHTVGESVRRLIHTLKKNPGNEDILGYEERLNPMRTHQLLMSVLRGVRTSPEMIDILTKSVGTFSIIIPQVLTAITEDNKTGNLLKTQFFLDFSRGFQLYGQINEKFEKGRKVYKSSILNKVKGDNEYQEFSTRVYLKNPLNSDAIYDTSRNVNWKNLNSLLKLVDFYFDFNIDSETNSILQASNKNGTARFTKLPKSQQISVLSKIFNHLDVKIHADSIETMLSNSRDRGELFKAIKDIINQGIKKAYTESTLTNLENETKKEDFYNLLKYKSNNSTGKDGVLEEKLKKINNLGSKYGSSKNLESRVSSKDKKGNTISLMSDVVPSFMTDFFGEIQKFAEEGSPEKLAYFLKNRFLKSSFFYNNSKYLNKWLGDLASSSLGKFNNFAKHFTFMRLLSMNDDIFENFTTKKDLTAIVVQYLFADNLKDEHGNKMARYPMFILGDSNISKYITAPRYNHETLVQGYYNIYIQELRRMAEVRAVNKSLTERGIIETGEPYKLIKNYSDRENEFIELPFLNNEVNSESLKTELISLEEFREILERNMSTLVKKFKNELVKADVIRKVEGTESDYTSDVFNPEISSTNTLDNAITDFYWNYKFATIQQLQLLGGGTAFYLNTKDLQKRYKEVHASRNRLDVNRKDENGNYYIGKSKNILDENGELITVPDTTMPTVYFDDIVTNGEITHNQFMNAILLQFGTVDRGTLITAISNGITKPLTDENAEKERLKTLKSHLGKNYEIYEAYRKASLTDGQAYRSVSSYMKVMRTEGLNTDAMEEAYTKIKEIRAKYKREDKISEQDLDELQKINAIFQPLKPFLYGNEHYSLNDNQELLIPTHYKCAEICLIPELLPNDSPLKEMSYWMEDHEVDVLASTETIKVGRFGSTNIAEFKEGETLSSRLDKGYIHKLDYNDYGIQTNVPEKMNSASSLFGTQPRKLSFANMIKGKDYGSYTNGNIPKLHSDENHKINKMTGDNVVSFYNSLIMANVIESLAEIEEIFTNPERLSNLLADNSFNNANDTFNNLLSYGLDENGNFSLPLFEGALEHDSSALLLSLFRHNVNKQKIKGGSFVQASSYGMTKKESEELNYIFDKDGNIIGAQIEIPFDLNYEDASGKMIPLNFNDWCDRDGSLKKDKNGNTLIEKSYPGILDIVAYRIPTEGHHSMINAKVVRFSQKLEGGTIRVPSLNLVTSGFDFDIDKLYFMRKSFVEKKLDVEKINYSDKDVSSIKDNHNGSKLSFLWEEYYKSNEYRYAKLKEAQNVWKNEVKRYEEKALEQRDAKFGDLTTASPKTIALANKYVEDYVNKKFPDRAEKENRQLHNWWQDAGLPESDTKAFEEFVKNRYEITTFDEYNYNILPTENSTTARNNMIIELIQKRMSDSETFKTRYTPGSFTESSTAARVMRELFFGDLKNVIRNGIVDFKQLFERAKDKTTDPEPNYDPSDPMTRVLYNQQNQLSGKLIGIFANHLTNHAFVSLTSVFQLVTPIKFGSHTEKGLFDLISDSTTNSTRSMIEFLTSSVDAVKDQVLLYLGFNIHTADVAGMLGRLGYDIFEIGLLLNQPIIQEVCELAINENISIDRAITDLFTKYKEGYIAPASVNHSVEFNTNHLALNIVDNRNQLEKEDNVNLMDINKEFRANQLNILTLFKQIKGSATDVTGLISATKFTAANSVPSTIGELYAQQMKVSNYIKKVTNKKESNIILQLNDDLTSNSPINNSEENLHLSPQQYIEKFLKNPLAYEQVMFDANRKLLKFIQKYYPYNTPLYINLRERLKSLDRRNSLDGDVINKLHRHIPVYLLSQKQTGSFYGNGIHHKKDGTSTTNREYYIKDFPIELFEYLQENPGDKELPIFEFMTFGSTDKDDPTKISIKMSDIGGIDKSYSKEDIIDSWKDIHAKNPTFANELFLYNFYKLGFDFSPFSFMNLAPIEVKNSIIVEYNYNSVTGKYDIPVTYTEFLNRVLEGKEKILNEDDFIKQFILNFTDNYNIVYNINAKSQIKNNVFKNFIEPAYKNNTIPAKFTIDLTITNSQFDEVQLGQDEELEKYNKDQKVQKMFAFKPVIILNNEFVYMAIGDGPKFNYSSTGQMTYVRVNKQGIKNKEVKYQQTGEILNEDGINNEFDNIFEATSTDNSTDMSEMSIPVKNDAKTALTNDIIESLIIQDIGKEKITIEDIETNRESYEQGLLTNSDAKLNGIIEQVKETAVEKGVKDDTGEILCGK